MTFLSFLANYWYLLIIAIAIISVLSVKCYIWFKKPNNEQIARIQEWLVWAVAQAEAKLGSETGQLKLRYVYDMFVTKFPSISIFISFDKFKAMVDNALSEFNDMLKNNTKLQLMFENDNIEIELNEDTPIDEKEVMR